MIRADIINTNTLLKPSEGIHADIIITSAQIKVRNHAKKTIRAFNLLVILLLLLKDCRHESAGMTQTPITYYEPDTTPPAKVYADSKSSARNNLFYKKKSF